MRDETEFRRELARLINRHSVENGSGTPDFILAEFLDSCLAAWDAGIARREEWYGRPLQHGVKTEFNSTEGPPLSTGDDERPLADVLCEKLRAWIVRAAPQVRDECDYASIEITLLYPGYSDDGTLHLDAKIEEKATTDRELCGTVPEIKR